MGIDFGTTKTMVAKYDRSKRCTIPLQLGRGAFELPSSIFLSKEDETLFGDEAEDEGLSDYINLIRRFKMKLGHQGPAHVGRKVGTAEELCGEFLRHLKLLLEKDVLHQELERASLTVPAMFTLAQRKEIERAALSAGFTQVELLDEPTAVGMAYCDQIDVEKELRFLVIDWGGGTFDVALVERAPDGSFRAAPEFISGLDDLGGESLDDHLWKAFSSSVVAAGYQALDKQDPMRWGQYRQEITRAKERLSNRDSVRANFHIDGDSPVPIVFERSTLEEALIEPVRKGAAFVEDLLKRCQAEGSPPEFILLAGGTARIPMIKRVFEEHLKIECRTWSQGREAIALGAALHARNLWGSTEPTKEPVQPSEPASKFESKSADSKRFNSAWKDGLISEKEYQILTREPSELDLSDGEFDALKKHILGKINEKKNTKLSLSIQESIIGCQVLALAPEEHTDLDEREFIQQTHFPVSYLLELKNHTRESIKSLRLSMTAEGGFKHSLLIPELPPSQSGTVKLSTSDLEGWSITPGDHFTADALGIDVAELKVTPEMCNGIDGGKALNTETPCRVFVRKASFSSNFVVRIVNITDHSIRLPKTQGFTSPSGTLDSEMTIEPNSEAEIGWCELSEGKCLRSGDSFTIRPTGYREIEGIVAEGEIKGNSAWKVLGGIGALAAALAGG